MLIPSIDLMGGKIVQLVQGERKQLEFSNCSEWIDRFRGFPLVQLIDLDAAMGKGNNSAVVAQIVQELPCQVGGGIRSIERAAELLKQGARRVIFGSALIRDAQPNIEFARAATEKLGLDSLTFAIDSKAGRVAIHGWREQTILTTVEVVQALQPFCGAFLYTHIDTEGMLQGISMQAVHSVKVTTSRKLMVAGGVSTLDEVNQIDAVGVDAIVGMAIYTGQIDLEAALETARKKT
jgi:phosphoribosylformimino-5-aminoimidazole carboxamide ribotide isomerase